jgi:glucokinase
MILAADVGGTKTLLGVFKVVKGKLEAVREGSFPSPENPSLERIVHNFLLAGREKIHRCAVGVAGPVSGGRSQVVNLKWPVDGHRLARDLGIDHVEVLNDLEATAWGIPVLPTRRFKNLTPGIRPQPGNAALIAAGTGMGTAGLFWDGEKHRPFAAEGGHQDFAPRDDLSFGLLKFVQRRIGRVSVERIVSGPGFSAIFDYLVAMGNRKVSRTLERRLAGAADRNAVISDAGVKREDPIATATVDLFLTLYGAAAGDLALVLGATNGVYVGGGIAPRILPRMTEGRFLKAFRDKGRLTPYMEKIPVKVILEPRTALLGAAACAAFGPVKAPPRRTRNRRKGQETKG